MSTMPTDGARLLRTDDAARRLGLSRSTLEKLRMRGDGPAYIRIGARAVAYRIADLDEWIATRPRLRSTSEADAHPTAATP